MCDGIYEMLADVFSACWSETREDAAAESADALRMRRVRDEAISALAPLREALGSHMARSGLEPME